MCFYVVSLMYFLWGLINVLLCGYIYFGKILLSLLYLFAKRSSAARIVCNESNLLEACLYLSENTTESLDFSKIHVSMNHKELKIMMSPR